ncbi:MAG: polymer-forming cytoskeletal protein [Pseudomonadota bacterium]|nr:polymer-forming cytoskeletal protein [Pseudomonadota bacterium]
MFGGSRKRSAKIETLVGGNTRIVGDLSFSGGLHVDGEILGSLSAEGADDALLSVSEKGRIVGDVRVSRIVLNGTVEGNVYCAGKLELGHNAKVNGDVYYNLIEVAGGAAVNGSLLHDTAGHHVVSLRHDVDTASVTSEPEIAAS